MTVMSDSDARQGMEPTKKIDVRKEFGLETDMVVHGFKERTEYVPAIDESYRFDPQTTMALLAGFDEAAEELFALEWLAGSVAFDH